MTDFADLIVAGDPAYLAAGERIHAARPDLQQAFPDTASVGFRKWLAASGVLEYPDELGRFFPPVPPEDLRRTGCGGAEAHGHLYTALEDLEVVYETWRLHVNRPLGEVRSVLDFGCGCGRASRWFAHTMPDAEIHGCDVRLAGIEWCREHLRGDYRHSSTEPPLPFETDSMDLVVALSLFSHFDRESSIAWMRELARVCRPDGRMIVTTHGLFSLWVIARSPEHQDAFFVDAAGAAELARRIQREDFLFHEPPADWLKALDGPSRDYGQAFYTERFVREAYADSVEVVSVTPAALLLFQDVYVLKPRT